MDMFKLNSKIELKSEDEQKTAGFIYDIKDDKLYISISADEEDFKLLKIGEKVYGAIYNRSEVIGFQATVTARVFTKNSVYELSQIKNFTKVQRRENIRVVFTKEIKYTDNEILFKQDFDRYDDKQTDEIIKKYFKEGLILDLSAGGLKLSTKENFKPGTKLIFAIDFKDEKMIIKGRIVHKQLNMIPNKTVYQYGVKFTDIKDGEQEKIIKHLFVIMRKNRIE